METLHPYIFFGVIVGKITLYIAPIWICDRIWENPPKRGKQIFQFHRVKPYRSIFFEKIFMAEMDRHQLALAYDAVVSSGVL